MKTFFITLPEDIVARNIFFTSFWDTLLKSSKDTCFVLLVPPERVEYYKSLWEKEGKVIVEAFKRSSPYWLEKAIMMLCRSGINSHTNRWSKMRSYLRGDSSFVSTYTKVFLTFIFGWSTSYKRLLRSLVLHLPAERRLEMLFDDYHPSGVFCTSLANFDFDSLIGREAKRRKIPLFGMVRSWDNLSSHGLLRVVPDVFILQNRFLKNMANSYQAIRDIDTTFHIVGLPHYDTIKDLGAIVEPRDSFLKRKGIDPSKRVLFYGAMGKFLFAREHELPEIFNSLIENGEFGENIHMLYRAHPKFMISKAQMQTLAHVTFDMDVKYIDKDKTDSAKNENADLVNSLLVSEVIITAASTIAIDAAIVDKPIVCVAFDGKGAKMLYWLSVKRFYDSYTHFEALMETGGARLARTPKELVKEVRRYLIDSALEKKERGKIVDFFVEPFDGRSGERLAKLVESEIGKI